jgi:VIT1/CCC1 family predicted Fe2+/Mn2+ transporter
MAEGEEVSEKKHPDEDSPGDVRMEEGLAKRLDLALQELTEEEVAKRLDLALQELTGLAKRLDLALKELTEKEVAKRLDLALQELTEEKIFALEAGKRLEAQIEGSLNEIARLEHEKRLLEKRIQTLEARKEWRPWRRGQK